MRDYELTLIINPDFSDEQLEATLNNVGRFVSERGGTVAEVDRWGKRRLAYPIKHRSEGNYVMARLQMEPALGRELEAIADYDDV